MSFPSPAGGAAPYAPHAHQPAAPPLQPLHPLHGVPLSQQNPQHHQPLVHPQFHHHHHHHPHHQLPQPYQPQPSASFSQPPLPPLPQHIHHPPATPHPHPSPFPTTPLAARAIHPLPQHQRLQLLQAQLPRTPSTLSRAPLPVPAATPAPTVARQTRPPRGPDATNARKRARRIVGDGFEAPYLQPGPTNRLLLSLKSGLDSQIDWALSRLAQHSIAKQDHLSLEHVPGLAEALLSYPRRLCAAIAGEPSEAWQGPNFEQGPDADDVGIGAPGEGDSQGGASWYLTGQRLPHAPTLALTNPVRRRLLLMPSSTNVERSRIGSLVVASDSVRVCRGACNDDRGDDDGGDGDDGKDQDGGDKERNATATATAAEQEHGYRDFSFDPAHVASHAALMRRALEAALILRNLTMQSSNARHLVSIRGVQTLVRNVLALPSMVLVREADADGQPATENEEWLELEGIAELRLHFLDLLEGIAPRLHLSQRALFWLPPPGLAGCSTVGDGANAQDDGDKRCAAAAAMLQPPNAAGSLKAADEIYLQLLDMVHHSPDRAFLIGSLRCLSAMAASERNEAAFVEATLAGGWQSPGLLNRCVELLPLNHDAELLEATLDLLYQLCCIGNNGLQLAITVPSSAIAATADAATASSKALASASDSARNFARTFAVVRLLVRNLGVGKVVWERDHKLTLHREWSYAVPGRTREAMRKEREARARRQNETPAEKARKKKLTRREKQQVIALGEPERGTAWMKLVFRGNPAKEVTQMEFWTAYKDEFFALAQANRAAPLQPAAELIRTVSQVFPGASAMVIPATAGSQPRFIISGIEVRERDLSEPFGCGWRSCAQPETSTAAAQRDHAEIHVRFSQDGRCQWLSCDYCVDDAMGGEEGDAMSDDGKRRALRAHVLTHLPAQREAKGESEGMDEQASQRQRTAGAAADDGSEAKASVEDALRAIGSGSRGEAVEFERGTMANGARFIKSKRDANGQMVPMRTRWLNGDALGSGSDGSGASKEHGSTAADLGGMGSEGNTETRPTPAVGTVDNPGSLTFEVARTPSCGAEENPSPQGAAFVSLLILRMLTRNAAAVLHKAGVRMDKAHAERGGGCEEADLFGLPLPRQDAAGASRSGELGGTEVHRWNARMEPGALDAQDKATVDAARSVMEAIIAVQDELVAQSFANDILCRYLNEVLVEVGGS
ncbi:hypothetical protein ACQY0O_003862 [Thecaphora frezii]